MDARGAVERVVGAELRASSNRRAFEIYQIGHHTHRETVGDGSAVPMTTIFFRNLSLRLSSLDLTFAARFAFCMAS